MKKKILQYFVCVIAAALSAALILLSGLMYGLFKNRVMEDLQTYADVFAAVLESGGGEEVFAYLTDDELRITLLQSDGQVLYDNAADAGQMENHAERPEIVSAFESGKGRDVRNSHTIGRSTYYYAVRLKDGRVLRLAKRASSLSGLYVRAIPLIVLLMALMMGICFVVVKGLTGRLLKSIGQMTAHLDDMSGVERYPELEPFMDMIQKQHEEILLSANMRVEFTANVSHELKTPLTSISGYAELIENGMATQEQAKKFAGEIHKSANRLLRLIDDIIRLSQMDAPMPDMVLEPVDLAKIAANTLDQLQMSAHKMGVTLQLDAHDAVVDADKRMMEELIYNLCDNAIRYNVHGGSVRVEARPVRDKVMVCVQDTGIGISEENQKHVFERFYRVDKSRSKATGGTGLGLAIVKHIAVKHHAALVLESSLGVGTTISVTFDKTAKA